VIDALIHGKGDVYAMVRAENDDKASERLSSAMSQLRCQIDQQQLKRLKVVRGDLALPMFGMSQSAFEQLSIKLGRNAVLIHNGALVNA
jgi:thioester reductase-like protein